MKAYEETLGEVPSLNRARRTASDSLLQVLSVHVGKPISECELATAWLRKMLESGIVTRGWYDPPPNGLTVLSGRRANFQSLRSRSSWPSGELIDWTAGICYFYSSSLDATTGQAGDVAITLYFGDDERIEKHFKNTYRAVERVLNEALSVKDSRTLYLRSEAIFSEYGLRNGTHGSQGSTTPPNLGHTLPSFGVALDPTSNISMAAAYIRDARQFISQVGSWEFGEYQFTVEPQLYSILDPDMPQVSYHYVVDAARQQILCEPDLILMSTRQRWYSDCKQK